ncbi:hypothetical protein QSJ18_19730 [Gordonia sp. ABSL1-1]|uniref:hypothetical protein n=1 Tax=Gordonia sp. ABSL1-1 TaxID=3053923 RepID=UPI002572909C|nr:hypothetical protein [Gordonia sp. ABSL1-1]MDL9938982.1 hypothetical protein [Gordonia sp. ABSL1-1]
MLDPDHPFAALITPEMLAERQRNSDMLHARLRAEAAEMREHDARSAADPTRPHDADECCRDPVARQAEFRRRLAEALEDEYNLDPDARVRGVTETRRAAVDAAVRERFLRELRAHLTEHPDLRWVAAPE